LLLKQDTIYEKRVTDLSLSEFLAYGPQKEPGKVGRPLWRKTKDGKIIRWDVASDDALCTLQEAFEKVDPKLGFNIELKFDDNIVYEEDFLVNLLQAILKVKSLYLLDLNNGKLNPSNRTPIVLCRWCLSMPRKGPSYFQHSSQMQPYI